MKINILNNLKENICIFNTDIFLLGKIKPCTIEELTKFDNFYSNSVPTVIKELFYLGGHNFFEYYFKLEYVTGYKLWERIQALPKDIEYYMSIPMESIREKETERIYLTVCQSFMLFVNVCDGNNPPVYELEYLDEPKINLKYASLLELIDTLIKEQKIEYLQYQKRKKEGKDEFTLEAQREIERSKEIIDPDKLPF